MEYLDELIEKYREIENALAILLMETESKIAEMERLNMDENKANETMNESQHKGVYVPLAAYEVQQERFFEERKDLMDRTEAEKDKMRKHYRRIVTAISVALIAMIIGVFAFAFYFLSNFTLATVSQDGAGLNNYVNQSSQVDVAYGAKDNGTEFSEPQQSSEGNLDQ